MNRFFILVLLASLAPLALAGEKDKPSETARKLVELTNQERKNKDAPPLTLNPLLCKVARVHSENMARQMKMEHKLDGKTVFDRLDDADYDFMLAAENLGIGNDDATLAILMKAWMDSKDHRANILHAEFTEIGIGIARDKKGLLYYTQIFGRPFKK